MIELPAGLRHILNRRYVKETTLTFCGYSAKKCSILFIASLYYLLKQLNRLGTELLFLEQIKKERYRTLLGHEHVPAFHFSFALRFFSWLQLFYYQVKVADRHHGSEAFPLMMTSSGFREIILL
jgi:hypothetical protein